METQFDSKEFARLLHLQLFYKGENNLVMAGVIEKEIDQMITNRTR